MGVFATRSPFRPNPLGLSCVRLVSVEYDTPKGALLHLAGADIMDGTPVYDIKPYLPYVDCRPDASNGFALAQQEGVLNVDIPAALCESIPTEKLPALRAVLAQDPRPQYISDPEREYTMSFAGYEISFTVDGTYLTVTKIKTS